MGKLRNKAVQTVCYQVVGPGFKLALVWLWSPNIFYVLLNDSKMSSLGEYVDGGATNSTGKRRGGDHWGMQKYVHIGCIMSEVRVRPLVPGEEYSAIGLKS